MPQPRPSLLIIRIYIALRFSVWVLGVPSAARGVLRRRAGPFVPQAGKERTNIAQSRGPLRAAVRHNLFRSA